MERKERKKTRKVRVEVKGEVEQLREKRSSWMVCEMKVKDSRTT